MIMINNCQMNSLHIKISTSTYALDFWEFFLRPHPSSFTSPILLSKPLNLLFQSCHKMAVCWRTHSELCSQGDIFITDWFSLHATTSTCSPIFHCCGSLSLYKIELAFKLPPILMALPLFWFSPPSLCFIGLTFETEPEMLLKEIRR